MSTEVLVPPQNFSMVCPGVYRSSYPSKRNFPFLIALKLRSICYLCPEEYAAQNRTFCEEHNVQVFQYPMEGNKEPFADIAECTVHDALNVLGDVRNHPVLIHCNKGKHRTGALCGCLRKLQGWSMASIFAEYHRFAGDKGRGLDQQFIELYRPALQLHPRYLPRWFDPGSYLIDVSYLENEDVASPVTPAQMRIKIQRGGSGAGVD